MKYLTTLALAGSMSLGFFACGCSQEVAHSEKDTPNMMGGRTHEESTTYRNPDGTYSTDKSKTRTNP